MATLKIMSGIAGLLIVFLFTIAGNPKTVSEKPEYIKYRMEQRAKEYTEYSNKVTQCNKIEIDSLRKKNHKK